jgi:hypothetical protein
LAKNKASRSQPPSCQCSDRQSASGTRETGRVIHIKFSNSFEKARIRKNIAERGPFGLMMMIVNPLGTVECAQKDLR